MSTKQNLTINQGETFYYTFHVTQPNGDDLPLSGYSAVSQLRQWYTSSTSYPFVATVITSNSSIQLYMSAPDTLAIEDGRYVYDVDMTSPAGQVTRVAEGIVTVRPTATK